MTNKLTTEIGTFNLAPSPDAFKVMWSGVTPTTTAAPLSAGSGSRISEMTPVGSADTTGALVEISVPSIASPTGYVTRSAPYGGGGGGGGGMSHRIPFSYTGDTSSSDRRTFYVEFDASDVIAHSEFSGAGGGVAVSAVSGMVIGMTNGTNGDEQPVMSQFMFNSNFNQGVITGTVWNGNWSHDGRYQLNGDPDSLIFSSTVANTFTAIPIEFWIDTDSETGSTGMVTFALYEPYEWTSPRTAVTVVGYFDVLAMTHQPGE